MLLPLVLRLNSHILHVLFLLAIVPSARATQEAGDASVCWQITNRMTVLHVTTSCGDHAKAGIQTTAAAYSRSLDSLWC